MTSRFALARTVLTWALLVVAIVLPPEPTVVAVAALIVVELAPLRPSRFYVWRAAVLTLVSIVGTLVLYAGL